MFASPKINDNGQVTYGNENGLHPVFSIEAVKDEEESVKQGRDVYRDVEWVTIHIVGDNLTKRSKPVDDNDRRRFPQHYEAFKNQSIQLHTGTPLTEWSLIGKSQALNLKSMNIHTVEQLAEVADGNLTWLGARELHEKAKAWLESAKGNSGISNLQAENDKLKREMEALKNQMTALMQDAGKKKKKADINEQDAS